MPLIGLYSRLLERLNATPGVRAASLLWFTPLSDSGWDYYVEVPGKPDIPKDQRLADINFVGPKFFEVMGMPLACREGFPPTATTAARKGEYQINELSRSPVISE